MSVTIIIIITIMITIMITTFRESIEVRESTGVVLGDVQQKGGGGGLFGQTRKVSMSASRN